jgi:hypothetical protein
MRFCLGEVVVVQNRLHHPVIKSDEFEQHFTISGPVVIFLTVALVTRHRNAFFERCIPEGNELRGVLIFCVVKARSCLVLPGRLYRLLLQVSQLLKNLVKLLLPIIFLICRFDHCDLTFAIHKVRSAWSAGELALDPAPLLLEVVLDKLQAV